MSRKKLSKRQQKRVAFNRVRKSMGYGPGWMAPTVRAKLHELAGHAPHTPAPTPDVEYI